MNIQALGRLRLSGFALPGITFKESKFLPEPQPRSLFEALRSKRFVRRMGVVLVLVMGSTFASLQAVSVDTGASSAVDNYLEMNVGGATTQVATHPDLNFTNGQTNGTWEAWVYPTRGIGREGIFSKDYNYIFGLDAGSLWAATHQGGAWRDNISNISLPLNAWSHVAFIKIGEGIVVYLNGAEVIYWPTGAFSTTQGNINSDATTNAFNVGRRQNGEYFSGRIDEVRVWNNDRRNNIASTMHTKVAGNSSGLQGYWDFNEPSGSIAYDRTTGGYIKNLTLVNSPTRADVVTTSAASNGDTVVTFTRTYLPGTGTWTVPANVSSVRALVIGGGGGGGGADDGGGGGAGGVITFNSLAISGSLSVLVGQGGNGGLNEVSIKNHATSGQDTYLGSVRALGGGGGGGYGYPAALSQAQG
jgi:hypothetical protein